jgi:phosphoserine phosphatase
MPDANEGKKIEAKSVTINCVFFDMDGTLTDVKSPWEKVFADNNLWHNNASILLDKYLAGEYDYEEFCKRDLLLWNNNKIKLKDIHKSLGSIPIRQDAINVLKYLTKNKVKCIIISTGFYYTAKKIASLAELNIEKGIYNVSADVLSVFANDIIEINDELILGLDVNGDYGHSKGKGAKIKECLKKLKISPMRCLSIGDSLVSDREMFELTADYVYVEKESDINNIIKKNFVEYEDE